MPPWIWPSTSVGLIGAADIVRGDDAQRAHRAELRCPPPPAPPARRRRRTHTGCPGRRHPAASSADRIFPCRTARGLPHRHPARAGSSTVVTAASVDERCARPPAGSSPSAPALQRRRSSPRSASPASFAALPLTKVWREALVFPASRVRSVSPATRSTSRHRHAERVGGDLQHDRVRSLADIDRAGEQHRAPVAADAHHHLGGIGQAGVADAVPHAGDAGAAPRRAARRRIERLGVIAQRAATAAGSRRDSRGSAAPSPSTCPVAVVPPTPSALRRRISHGSMPEPRGEHVHQRLAGDRRLRHAEAAERAGRRRGGVDRRRRAQHVRHRIRSRRMHRHAVGDRRSPARVGAGVEVAVEAERDQSAVRVRRGLGRDARGMALRRRRHALGARVDHAHRPAQQPRCHATSGCTDRSSLPPKPPPHRGRHDAHLLGRDAEDRREFVAVHVRRLRAGDDFDAVADAARVAGFRLDIGVLDETRAHRDLGMRRAGAQRRRDVAARHPAAAQHVAGRVGVQVGRRRPRRRT